MKKVEIMKFSKMCFAAAAAAIVWAGAAFAADGETMKAVVGGTEYGRPYIFRAKDGGVDGFEHDMWTEIAKRANLEVEYKFNSFAALFGMMDNGEIDVIAHFVGCTPARLEKYAFSDIYAYAALRLMLKEGSAPVSKAEDLWGKSVGVSAGSAAAGVLKRLDPEGKIDIRIYDNWKLIPRDVEMDRVFAYFGNSVSMINDMKAMGVKCMMNPWILNATKVAYPYSRGREYSEKLMARVNKALADMGADGTIKKISEKWFSLDVTISD